MASFGLFLPLCMIAAVVPCAGGCTLPPSIHHCYSEQSCSQFEDFLSASERALQNIFHYVVENAALCYEKLDACTDQDPIPWQALDALQEELVTDALTKLTHELPTHDLSGFG
eukprot:950761_1